MSSMRICIVVYFGETCTSINVISVLLCSLDVRGRSAVLLVARDVFVHEE